MASVTNFHRFGGLKQHTLIEVQNWGKSKESAGLHFFLEALENMFIAFSSFYRLPALLGLCLLLSVEPAMASRVSHDITLTLTLLLPASIFKDLYWDHLDNPGKSPSFKVSWLANLTPSTTLIPQHICFGSNIILSIPVRKDFKICPLLFCVLVTLKGFYSS